VGDERGSGRAAAAVADILAASDGGGGARVDEDAGGAQAPPEAPAKLGGDDQLPTPGREHPVSGGAEPSECCGVALLGAL